MAPQRLEKIESAPGKWWGPEAPNLQDVVHGRAADHERLRLTSRKNDKVALLQKKAPNALKSLHAELKSAPAVRNSEATHFSQEEAGPPHCLSARALHRSPPRSARSTR